MDRRELAKTGFLGLCALFSRKPAHETSADVITGSEHCNGDYQEENADAPVAQWGSDPKGTYHIYHT